MEPIAYKCSRCGCLTAYLHYGMCLSCFLDEAQQKKKEQDAEGLEPFLPPSVQEGSRTGASPCPICGGEKKHQSWCNFKSL